MQEINDNKLNRVTSTLSRDVRPSYTTEKMKKSSMQTLCIFFAVLSDGFIFYATDFLFFLSGDLFTNITDEKDYIPACNFLADRLRAVRQDLIVQQCNWGFAVPILELIVKYHIHITWKLRHFSSQDSDKTLNKLIRNSYIGDLFEYYQYLIHDGNAFGLKNYPEFLAYKVLLNYSNSFIIMEANQKLLWIRENYGNQQIKVIVGPLQFCLSYHTRNFSRMFSLLNEFHNMQKMCVLNELNKFRVEFLQILNYAYTNKLLKFQCDKLKSWLHLNTKEATEEFVKTCGIKVKDGFVLFANKSLHINFENDKIKKLVERNSVEDDVFIGEASCES